MSKQAKKSTVLAITMEEAMRMLRMLLVLFMLQFFIGQAVVYGETIYTKDGEVIQGNITEEEEGTVWYEVTTTGDIIEEIGIDLIDIERILNDDGSVSEYSPK